MDLTQKVHEMEHGPSEQSTWFQIWVPQTHNLVLHCLSVRIYHQQYVTFCCQNCQTSEYDVCQCEQHGSRSSVALCLSESHSTSLYPLRVNSRGKWWKTDKGMKPKSTTVAPPPQFSPGYLFWKPTGHVLEQILALF